MKRLLTYLLLLAAMYAQAQTPEMFTPVHPNNLRLPSVPLITVDPYVSYWCRFDHLYDSETEHWSQQKKPMLGVLRVDGKAYRVTGASRESIVPMADDAAWTAKYITTTPKSGWTTLDFDDSSWKSGQAPFGGGDDGYKKVVNTVWEGGNVDIYARRVFTLDEIDERATYSVQFKHDDVFELYLNGKQVVKKGEEWNTSGVTVDIDRSLLNVGDNILAAHCHNTTGGAFLDFGLCKSLLDPAVQTSCTTLATNTYYTFTCGGVDMTLVFTAPMIMDDLDLFSTPINYISYQVTPNDGKEHEVEFLFEASPRITTRQNATTRVIRKTSSPSAAPSLQVLYTGNATQDHLRGTGDGDNNIDWGYFYIVKAKADANKKLTIAPHNDLINEFLERGQVETELQRNYTSLTPTDTKTFGLIDSIGTVKSDGYRSFLMIGYDDGYSIQYFGNNRKGYWSNNGKVKIETRFEDMYVNYESIMTRCREVDEQIYTDAYESDGEKYAELLSAVYRQCCAAHKLFRDQYGNLMYMSRENNSGGFINTMDVTYPSQPLFFLYNPALAKGMVTPCLEYTRLKKWAYPNGTVRPFCNHDLGGYPKANGQTYGMGDPNDDSNKMPVEESGNALCLLAVISHLDQDKDYLIKYWDILTNWVDYLVEYGKDPTNQLCTDDFMGHSPRNANLAAKAIMGVMSYAQMAELLGKDDVAEKYRAIAQEMKDYWVSKARTSVNGVVHYTLQFGSGQDTWSIKYNLIWDKVWGWDLFKTERNQETRFYYANKRKKYGMPLDNRSSESLCKNDWHMWIAAMTDYNASARKWYFDTMWKFANECPTRKPLTDCHDANGAHLRLFFARSVVGGYWMPVFVKKFNEYLTSVDDPQADVNVMDRYSGEWYDLYGRKVTHQAKQNVLIHNGKKILMMR